MMGCGLHSFGTQAISSEVRHELKRDRGKKLPDLGGILARGIDRLAAGP